MAQDDGTKEAAKNAKMIQAGMAEIEEKRRAEQAAKEAKYLAENKKKAATLREVGANLGNQTRSQFANNAEDLARRLGGAGKGGDATRARLEGQTSALDNVANISAEAEKQKANLEIQASDVENSSAQTDSVASNIANAGAASQQAGYNTINDANKFNSQMKNTAQQQKNNLISNSLQTALNMGGTVAGLASDESVKDIHKYLEFDDIDTLMDKVIPMLYNYKGDDKVDVGVSANELEKTGLNLVHRDPVTKKLFLDPRKLASLSLASSKAVVDKAKDNEEKLNLIIEALVHSGFMGHYKNKKT